jgi:hypothetical protein
LQRIESQRIPKLIKHITKCVANRAILQEVMAPPKKGALKSGTKNPHGNQTLSSMQRRYIRSDKLS